MADYVDRIKRLLEADREHGLRIDEYRETRSRAIYEIVAAAGAKHFQIDGRNVTAVYRNRMWELRFEQPIKRVVVSTQEKDQS